MEANNLGIRIEDNVLKGKDVPYTSNHTNLGKAVLDILENNEDFVGLVDPVTDEKYTYGTMRERSVRCALWMKAQGVQPGDVVTICSNNKLDTRLPCLAALYIGAVCNLVDPAKKPKRISHVLNICKPIMAFVDEESATTIAEAAKGVEIDVKIVVFGRVPGFFEYETIIAEPKDDEVKNFRIDRNGSPDETAFVLFSSGTTGIPKGVALGHKSFLAILDDLEYEKIAGLTGMMYSSISWISGISKMFISLFAKMTVIVPPPFEEYSSCEIIEKYKVNYIYVSPNMINRWLKSDALGKYDLSTLKRVVTAGSPVSWTYEAFAKYLPHTMVSVVYGITEAGGRFVSGAMQPKQKPGLCGRTLDNVQLKVVDPVTGRIYGADTTGEFLLKTPTMMNYYYNDPQATADAVDEEGWLRTGDLGYYDEDGNIFFVDRLKSIMKYRNHQVSPAEVERVLWNHPAVKDAVVVGLSHPEDGEHPIAFVVKVTDPSFTGKEVTESELVDLVASELSDAKRLRGGVRFVDSLPKTATGKIRRKAVQDMANSIVKNQGN